MSAVGSGRTRQIFRRWYGYISSSETNWFVLESSHKAIVYSAVQLPVRGNLYWDETRREPSGGSFKSHQKTCPARSCFFRIASYHSRTSPLLLLLLLMLLLLLLLFSFVSGHTWDWDISYIADRWLYEEINFILMNDILSPLCWGLACKAFLLVRDSNPYY